jgi:hypothetical protein
MTFVATIFGENLFPIFRVPCGRGFALFTLLCGVLRAGRWGRKQEDRANRGQNDDADSISTAMLNFVRG